MLAPDTRFGSHRLFMTRNGKYAGTVFIILTLMWLLSIGPEGITMTRTTEAHHTLGHAHHAAAPQIAHGKQTNNQSSTPAVGMPVWDAVAADRKCRQKMAVDEELVFGGDGEDGGAAPNHGSPTKVMFIGDSITTGVAKKGQRVHKVRRENMHPKEGTCSYRISLLKELEAASKKHGHSDTNTTAPLSIEAVGPYTDAFAGRSPRWCWSGFGGDAVAAEKKWNRHGATWGIRVKQVNERASYKKRSKQQGDATPSNQPSEEIDRGDSFFWTRKYRPDLVFVLLGTNDFYDSDAETIVDESLSQLLGDVFAGSSASDHSPPACGCSVRVVVSLLLPRADRHDTVDVNNRMMQRVHTCHQGNSTIVAAGQAAAKKDIWCHPCLTLGDPTGGVLVHDAHHDHFDVKQHTYDGLHPNHGGEELVGYWLAQSVLM